jgi:hypothetical protein
VGRGLTLLLLVCGTLPACSLGAYDRVDDIPDDPAPSTASGHFGLGFLGGRSPLVEGEAPRILAELGRAIGTRSIQCESADLYFDRMVLYVSKGNGDMDYWGWREGSLEEPRAERSRDLKPEQLFEISEVPWDKLAHLRIIAKQYASFEGAQAKSVSIRRSDGRLRIDVSISGTRRSATVEFGANGALLKVVGG